MVLTSGGLKMTANTGMLSVVLGTVLNLARSRSLLLEEVLPNALKGDF